MKVFQIGAAGGIGQPLTRLLAEHGDQPTGMHRAPEQARIIQENGGTAVYGDLITSSVNDLAELFKGSDAVVFSAGAHGTGAQNTSLIDGEGLEKAAQAALQAGVSRFVLVSVFPDAGRGTSPREGFEHYMRVKKTADVYLTRTSLDWLIIRPGTLRDEPGDGLVEAGLAVEYGSVRRDNVAEFIFQALANPALNHKIIELTDGTTPAADAAAILSK